MPAASTVDTLGVFTKVIAGAGGAVTFAVSVLVTGSPFSGGAPDTLAVFEIVPASISDCVTTYVAVHEPDCNGSSADGFVTHDVGVKPARSVSVTETSLNSTFPVFVAVKV